jgi:hypothetical protein
VIPLRGAFDGPREGSPVRQVRILKGVDAKVIVRVVTTCDILLDRRSPTPSRAGIFPAQRPNADGSLSRPRGLTAGPSAAAYCHVARLLVGGRVLGFVVGFVTLFGGFCP